MISYNYEKYAVEEIMINQFLAQIYYPVFERQYIDPLTFKEKRKGLVSFEPGDNENALLLVLVMGGVILFVFMIVLTYNYIIKRKKKRSRLRK